MPTSTASAFRTSIECSGEREYKPALDFGLLPPSASFNRLIVSLFAIFGWAQWLRPCQLRLPTGTGRTRTSLRGAKVGSNASCRPSRSREMAMRSCRSRRSRKWMATSNSGSESRSEHAADVEWIAQGQMLRLPDALQTDYHLRLQDRHDVEWHRVGRHGGDRFTEDPGSFA